MTNTQSIKENPLGYRPISKLMLSLAIPAVIANVITALYNIVDQIFIGQGIGYLGNAATNIAFPLTTICLAIGLMTGLGSAANFNLELGRKNPDEARMVAGTAATSLLIAGILLSAFVWLNLEPLMIAFGATDRILDYAMEYTGITAFGIPFLLFSTGINPLVRADGNAKYSMIAVVTGAVLNIILDPLFIFVFDMGISGAAWATVISQIVSAVLLASYFPRFETVKFELIDFVPRFHEIKVIVALGITSFVFQFSNMLILILTNNLLRTYGGVSHYGSDIPIAVAGIVIKINIIFTSIIIGIVQGSQPIFGFNYGAEKYGRVRSATRLLLKSTFIISVTAFLIFQIFTRQIISLFGDGNELYYEFATRYMRTYSAIIFITGIQIANTTFFPAIGKAFKGAFLALAKQMIFLMPLLLILPRFTGIYGIALATPVADFLAFVLSVSFMIGEFRKMPREDILREEILTQNN